MANPRDDLMNAPLNERREMYIHRETGRTHIRAPAGGVGGGITSYADVPATEEQHVAFLKAEAERKHAEGDVLHQQHEEASDKLARDRETDEVKDINNPITSETYGRPPQHSDGLGSQKGPHNPADERDPIDNQPRSSPVKEDA